PAFRARRSWTCAKPRRWRRRRCRREMPRRSCRNPCRMTTGPPSARMDRPTTRIFSGHGAAWTRGAMADFLGLMKQAAELKSKMEAMQAELDQIEVEGTSGGGLVSVKLSGKGEMKAVKIDDTLIKPSEKEIVEDLIVAAHTDARRKAEGLLQEK